MRKYPIYLQDENYSCGAYCIMMILKYFKMDEEIDYIKKRCKMTHLGITMYGLIQCLKYYHIEANGYEVELDYLAKHMKFPCILHTLKNDMLHYIVLYKVEKGMFIVADPGVGLLKMTLGELSQIYLNKAVVITFVSKPIDTSRLTLNQFLISIGLKYKEMLFKVLSFSVVTSILMVLINNYFKIIIDTLTQNYKISMIIVFMISTIFICLVKAICDYFKNKAIFAFEEKLNIDIILDVLKQLFRLPDDYYQRYLKHDTILKTQSLFELPHYMINAMSTVLIDGIMVFVFLFTLLFIQKEILKYIILVLIIIALISYSWLNNIAKLDHSTLNTHQFLSDSIMNAINYQSDIKTFGIVDKEKNKLESKFNKFMDSFMQRKKQMSNFQIMMNSFMIFLSISIFGYGAFFIENKELSLGELMLCYTIVAYLIDPLIRLVELLIESKKMKIIFERYKTLQIENLTYTPFDETINAIAFKNVKYAYGYKAPILEHITELFTHHKLVVGENGSGKSTFLKLLSGKLTDYEGTILINHTDLKEIDPRILEEKIGYLDANPYFYEVNVLEFILSNHEDKQPFLFKLINKYNLEELSSICHLNIDKQGNGLSKGQMQLVAFMRMLVLDYDVYIFDEAFSHMSEKVKDKVYKILQSEFFNHKIMFVVDHQINHSNKFESCVIINKTRVEIARVKDEFRN